MTIDKLATTFYKLCTAQHSEQVRRAWDLLVKINTSPYHYLATDDMTLRELATAKTMETFHGWVALIPANHGRSQEVLRRDEYGDATEVGSHRISPSSRKLPERYVVTVDGADALKSFEGITLSKEMREWEREENRPRLLDEWNSKSKPLGDF